MVASRAAASICRTTLTFCPLKSERCTQQRGRDRKCIDARRLRVGAREARLLETPFCCRGGVSSIKLARLPRV